LSTSKSDDDIPPGILAEFLFAYYLRIEGVRWTMTTVLDEDHAIDILATGHRRLKGQRTPIAIQITRSRRSNGKAKEFARKAGLRTKGPLLYVKFRCRPTRKATKGLAAALVELWTDPARQTRRAHAIVLKADGTYHWMAIPQPDGSQPRRL
jgi:hypothetical protein